MKIRLLGGLFVVLTFVASSFGAGHKSEWEQVDAAAQAGLPKTAIERLEPIIKRALAEKSYPEAVRAITRKIALEGAIQGDKPDERISRLQAEIAQTPPPMHPVMEAILAHWYWQYFQDNRWRFMRRTATVESPGTDIQTWDLRRILAEIDRHFSAALADQATLKKTPIGDYDILLEKGTAPDEYRPTLFDFLAYDALEFYQTGEQGVTVGEEEFELSADGPIFDDAEAFMKWTPETTDAGSAKLKAIRLYQALLRFHESDANRSAFYDADLARLTFGNNSAVGEGKEDRYEAALRRFIERTADHEVSARATAELARIIFADGDPVKAHDLARDAMRAFPDTAGAVSCQNLIQRIEAKALRIQTEHVWTAPWPTIDVTYRNVTSLYFRVVRMDFGAYVTSARWGIGNSTPESVRELLAREPALAWKSDLPATRDYRDRTEKLPAPSSLKPGFYLVLASGDRPFREDKAQLSVTPIWVSNLALVLRHDNVTGQSGGLVVNATSGLPTPGATVRVWAQNPDGWLRLVDTLRTDDNGGFSFKALNERVVVLAEAADNAVSTMSEFYSAGASDPVHAEARAVFFTDRAIYRPGQAIQYKGVTVQYDQNAAKYAVRAGVNVTVLFNDANGREIARATHQSNDYGSFSGVFTAPRDRLTGQMTISVEGGSGQTQIRVEEYKRPKFQVELKPPAEAAKLGAAVEVAGQATAYTGAAINGAKVTWRVERNVQLPYWCWWWNPPSTKAIAHGTATTEPDGTFKVHFTAEPDHAVPVKNEPVFAFTVYADVTDTTGETRSDDRTIRAGYAALEAAVTAEDWQTPEKPVEFTISTKSLDGDPQVASGKLTLHALKQPATVQRAALGGRRYWNQRTGDERPDPANPDAWELADAVATQGFTTKPDGTVKLTVPLKPGIYRAALETKDRFGHAVTARQTVQVLDPAAKQFAVRIANRVAAPSWATEPGQTFTAYWGTGYAVGRAFIELECNGEVLRQYWTSPDETQERIELPITEKMRGGVTLRVTYVRENRPYITDRTIDVPWTNKELTVKWESFRSKLTPGQPETWAAVVKSHAGERATAEMVATLYDASLDQFVAHDWPREFDVLRHEYSHIACEFENDLTYFQNISGWRLPERRPAQWSYRSFPQNILGGSRGDMITLSAFEVRSAAPEQGYMAVNTLAGTRGVYADKPARPDPSATMLGPAGGPATEVEGQNRAGAVEGKPDLSKVTARRNLNETAFFFPHLLADRDGVVKITFTAPEALTEWKFLGFAHDAQLRSGFLQDKAVTSKDVMVEPNPPRFLREGDVVEFTVKVTNTSDTVQTGTVRLTFANAETEKSADAALGNRTTDQKFEVPAKQSRSYSWRIAVPDGGGFLTYKAVAATAKFSDGEEGYLPVLSRRVLVTESLLLPIRGQTTKQFEFKKLIESGASETLRQQSLTVQMTSQPAWYAVMALPYLMEYPYECSEQVFNRYYANALARHIAKSDPKIRRVFDLWKNTPALDSPLEKNQDLKAVMLAETPWVNDAKEESAARRKVGLLFDANRLDAEADRTLQTLADRQLSEGLWSWFPGGRPSEYISLYIMTGFGRLRHLGVTVDIKPALKSLAALDAWMAERYRQIQKTEKPAEYIPGYFDALYLYGRTFFLQDQPIAGENKAAVDFFVAQARRYWLKVGHRQSEAQLALALQRLGDPATAQAIVRSLKERSVTDDELGMFWRDAERSWWWYEAPIETQAMMIEVFDEVAHDAKAVDDCRVWLLKQKQTENWESTKATADAIYGLLLHGSNLLSSDALVRVSLGGTEIKPEHVEAGTGFYEQKFVRDEIKPAMGHITVTKTDEGVSWGSVHWQYLEDMAKVTPHEGTPLQLKKTLWVKETTAKGQVLKPVTGPVSVGDELVVRIELRTDRDMEFVHLKDQRGSGTEPVNVLSRYRYQDGLAYYESTRDTATHFFIDYLSKGTYVFEYSTRVQLKGRYQTGIAEIQCMYAPEFNSHSESIPIEVKP